MRRVIVGFSGRRGGLRALALGALLAAAGLSLVGLKAKWALMALAAGAPAPPPFSPVAGPVNVPPPPALQAASAVLFDLDSGRFLYTHNAYERRPPGDLTKIVTALVVFRRGGLAESVRIGRDAVNAPGYSLRLEEGEELPLGDLVTYTLFHPSYDGAIAIAEHVAGSVEAFAGQMEAVALAERGRSEHVSQPPRPRRTGSPLKRIRHCDDLQGGAGHSRVRPPREPAAHAPPVAGEGAGREKLQLLSLALSRRHGGKEFLHAR